MGNNTLFFTLFDNELMKITFHQKVFSFLTCLFYSLPNLVPKVSSLLYAKSDF